MNKKLLLAISAAVVCASSLDAATTVRVPRRTAAKNKTAKADMPSAADLEALEIVDGALMNLKNNIHNQSKAGFNLNTGDHDSLILEWAHKGGAGFKRHKILNLISDNAKQHNALINQAIANLKRLNSINTDEYIEMLTDGAAGIIAMHHVAQKHNLIGGQGGKQHLIGQGGEQKTVIGGKGRGVYNPKGNPTAAGLTK